VRTLHIAGPGDRVAAHAKPQLRPWTRLDVEQARQFLMELPGRCAEADLPAAMFLLGQLESHAHKLLDVLDTVVTP
jgi:hypothetical protein